MSTKHCKGTNCNASGDNGFKHSSECLFDYARASASGIKSVSIELTIPDHFTVVIWRGHRIKLESHQVKSMSCSGVHNWVKSDRADMMLPSQWLWVCAKCGLYEDGLFSPAVPPKESE